LEDLANEIHAAGTDHDTKVIILRSGGEKAFCAGASFDELAHIENEKKGFDFFRGFADVINAMRKCPKLIIGRVHGKCIGGGVGLAAAVDYAIAHDSAEVRLSELAIGILLLMLPCGVILNGQNVKDYLRKYIQLLKEWMNRYQDWQMN
jgi:methylglutaconyl-CoA hydratase